MTKTVNNLRDAWTMLNDIRGETTKTIVGLDRPRIDRARKALALRPLEDGEDVAVGLESTLSLQLARYRDHDALPALYKPAVREGDDLFFYVHAAGLKPGDRIDLEDDIYADGAVHGEGGSEFQYELGVVETVTMESAYTVVVHTNLTSFACPPDHRLAVELCDTCEGCGYFFNPGPNDDAIVVTRCDHCDRFEGDLEAGRHAAKLRGWGIVASAWKREGDSLYLASIEEGAVLASDGEVPALAWIADHVRIDVSNVADGYIDSPYVVEYHLERLP